MSLFDKVNQAKEVLGEKAVHIIVSDLGITDWDENKLCITSIFRPSENTPSMLWDKDNNCFHCFATDNNYGIIDHFMAHYNESYMQSAKRLFELVDIKYNEKEFAKTKEGDLPNDYKFPKDEPENNRAIVEEYLLRRAISPKTLDFCSVKQSYSGDIAFQLKDKLGRHLCTKYRVSSAPQKGRPKWYWQKGADECPVLYNLDKIDLTKPIVITEGYCDTLSVVEAGFANVVSINGGANDTNWINFNYEVIEQMKEIILWFDDDDVGTSAVNDIAYRLGLHRVKVVKSNVEIKTAIAEYYSQFTSSKIDKMDANNVLVACGKDAVLDCIRDAKEIENPRIKKLMDIDETFIKDLPRIPYGFRDLDRILLGNFINNLTIISGKQGSGKSTVLNTLFINEPLEAGQKVFVYSGEMPADILLGTILRPIASRRHILMLDNSELDLPNSYYLTPQATKKIKQTYRDGIYFYDTVTQLEASPRVLLETMEYCYKRYGVVNFIIDNLMTVDCSKGHEDKYEGQKNFVASLKLFTNLFPVRVALVAHSKKLPHGAKEMTDDDVQGASEIIKLCDRCISVTRLIEDEQGYDALVTVLKDRQTGKVGKKSRLFYDEASNRLYANAVELYKKYYWEDKSGITYNDDIASRLTINTLAHKEPNNAVLNHIS